MTNLTPTKTLAATALAAAMLTLPTTAFAGSSHYNNYTHCKKSGGDDQIVAGLLGAVAGGVLGSQVSGNGARTEGSVLGAAIGAAAGAGLAGNGRKDCYPQYRSGTSYSNSYTRPAYNTAHNYHHYNNHNYNNQGYGSGYNNEVARIKRQIEHLRAKRRRLEARLYHQHGNHHHSRKLKRKIKAIGYEIDHLKKRKRRLKKRRSYNGYGHNYGNGHGHYHKNTTYRNRY